jgi:TRAP-type C4-dicarboxylate transport system permease small subunit
MKESSSNKPGIIALIAWTDHHLSLVLEAIMSGMICFLGIIVFVTVVLRYGFSYSFFGMHESLPVIFAHTTAIGAALAVARREHISVPAIFDILPESWHKYLDVLIFVLLIVINGVIFWQSIGWLQKTGFFMMPSLQIPQIYAKSSISIATILSIIFCINRIIMVLFANEKPIWFSEKGQEGKQ